MSLRAADESAACGETGAMPSRKINIKTVTTVKRVRLTEDIILGFSSSLHLKVTQ
jgi:hypothetical protein